MSNRFNPYQAWFGLSTSTKPSYYELLGLRNFETEPPVIAEAAELRMQLLAPHKNGPNGDSAVKLEREVTGVMNVLLSPDKRKQYDEKLRKDRGMVPRAPSAASTDDMLPPALSAAEAPSSMLPPGAAQMPPGSQMPPMMPGAEPGGYPGYASPGMPQPQYGAMDPYGAPPPQSAPQPYDMPTQAFVPGQQPYGAPAQPFGMPQQAQGVPQQAYGAPTQAYGAPNPAYGSPAQSFGAPAYASAAPMPTSAGPYGTSFPSAPTTPAYATAASPYASAAPAASPYGDPSQAAAPFTSTTTSQRTRFSGARKQKNSNLMIALMLLGGGAGVLAIIMLVVAAGNKPKPAAQPSPHIAVVPPNKMNSEDLMRRQAEEALKSGKFPTPAANNDTFGKPGTYRSASQSELMAESVVPNGSKPLPSMPDLVQAMAPKGAVPSIATPKPPDTVPSFEVPKAVPTATPAATAAMPATPAGVPAIAGTDGPKPAMEASLPADPARARSVQTMLGQARKFLKSRDYGKAEEIILQTEVLADVPDLIATAQNHNRLSELLRTFWGAAKEGVKSLKDEEELTYDGKTVKVVKHDEFNLVVKGSDNKEVVLIIDKLVPGLAVQMAERTLPKDDATTKSALAAFYGVDQAGDRAKATALLDEAKSLGADVDGIRAVIESGT